MTDVYKILGSVAPEDGTRTVLYDVPLGKSAIIPAITVVNRGDSDGTFDLIVATTSMDTALEPEVKYYLYKNAPILGFDTRILDVGMNLDQQSRLIFRGNGSMTAVVSGTETTEVGKYKLLASAGGSGSEQILYTVPPNKQVVISGITITNTAPQEYGSLGAYVSLHNDVGALVSGSVFVAVGPMVNAQHSTDGITWVQPEGGPQLDGAAFGNGVFTAVSSQSNNYYSLDGSTWSVSDLLSGGIWGPAGWRDVAYGNGIFVAVGTYGGSSRSAYSTDGITWPTMMGEYWGMPSSDVRSVAYGNGVFVAVGYYSDSAVSTDGITWTAGSMPGSNRWETIAYGNGNFVALSYDGQAASSTDGITWTARTMPSSPNWDAVTYGSGKFIAVGYYSPGAVSTDGITWTAGSMPTMPWTTVGYGNGVYTALGGYSAAASSTDGITWTLGVGYSMMDYGSRHIVVGLGQSISPATTANDYVIYNLPLAGTEALTLKAGYSLPSGGGIRWTSTSDVSIKVFGAEF